MTLAETAYAKVNLALHVRRRRADGYHEIETIFVFADFGDSLTATPADTISLTIGGQFGAGLPADSTNLVMRAAEALARRYDVRGGAAISLDKALPVASGLGGGSADAAAALRLLDRLWRLDAGLDALAEIGAGLGADVPACVFSRTARGDGIGADLQFLNAAEVAGRHILLVNPRTPVATGPVFAGWDGIDRGPLAELPPCDASMAGRNDLEASAIRLCPAIADVLQALRSQRGAKLIRMSGSGATCFAVFDGEAAATRAKHSIESTHPDWWSARGRLR